MSNEIYRLHIVRPSGEGQQHLRRDLVRFGEKRSKASQPAWEHKIARGFQ